MNRFPFKKPIALIVCILFMHSNVAWAAPTTNGRSIFSNKQVNVDAIRQQKQDFFDKKKQLHPEKGDKEQQQQQAAPTATAHNGAPALPEKVQLAELADLHIPEDICHISDYYDATKDPNAPATTHDWKKEGLILHIQDLHTQPEAQYNLAKIIDHIQTHYG
ncbi:MAG: hypothetical protein JW844_06735, partial [Candidatus Omnitrophica bacterium]|nr:hypothetical protein [Candidatus Omnitrophota bacterium]